MKKTFVATIVFIFSIYCLHAQVVAGPMLGQVELRDAKIWLEVAPEAKSVKLVYNKKGETSKAKTITYKGELGKEFNPIKFTVGGLDVNTTYQYGFLIDGKQVKQSGEFTTKDLWQWRKPVPDFSFITGSCSYFNEPAYDRPGKPYGGDSSIFETMAKEKAAFMLWLGDNWYTREVDYYSVWGLWYRAQHDRKKPVLQNFLKAMPHHATWDDHDYGPNNMGSNYILKDESKKIFDSYWSNASSGQAGEGIYTMFTYGDADIFLCDDRWWRSADDVKDSIHGKLNPDKIMLGEKQLQWLKNSLLHSQAAFKIIVIGSQVLNPASPYDKLLDFSAEYNELVNFLTTNKVNGVLFMSGDRHHTEIIKVDRPGTYPLFDLTISPLTSGTYKFSGPEKENPYRVLGIDEKQNYGKISFTGKRGSRKLIAEFLGIKGEKLGDWSVMETELKTPSLKK
jgi:alkaline phosphatase D